MKKYLLMMACLACFGAFPNASFAYCFEDCSGALCSGHEKQECQDRLNRKEQQLRIEVLEAQKKVMEDCARNGNCVLN